MTAKSRSQQGFLGRLAAAFPITVNLGRGERIVILLNGDAKMSRGKAAAQAVHAALTAHGIEHGPVVVLNATAKEIREQCDVQIRDAGQTEVEPGTLTAGVRRSSECGHPGHKVGECTACPC